MRKYLRASQNYLEQKQKEHGGINGKETRSWVNLLEAKMEIISRIKFVEKVGRLKSN